MTTHATRLVQAHPWGTVGRREERRSAPSLRWSGWGRAAWEAAGGALAIAATLGLWSWFFAATL